jgi:hypothetical protein
MQFREREEQLMNDRMSKRQKESVREDERMFLKIEKVLNQSVRYKKHLVKIWLKH